MLTNRASVPLRIVQLADVSSTPGNSLESLSTRKLPQGSLVLTNDTGTLYRLDKQSALTPDGTGVVTALNGGRWIALWGSSADALFTFQVRLVALTAPITTPSLANEWAALSSNANRFGSAGSGLFSLNTTTGVVTYNGPTRSFVIIGCMSGVVSSSNAAQFEFSVSRTGAVLIGTQTDPQMSALCNFAAGATGVEYDNMTFQDLVTLEAGDTVQACLRNLAGTDGFSMLRYGMLLQPGN